LSVAAEEKRREEKRRGEDWRGEKEIAELGFFLFAAE